MKKQASVIEKEPPSALGYEKIAEKYVMTIEDWCENFTDSKNSVKVFVLQMPELEDGKPTGNNRVNITATGTGEFCMTYFGRGESLKEVMDVYNSIKEPLTCEKLSEQGFEDF